MVVAQQGTRDRLGVPSCNLVLTSLPAPAQNFHRQRHDPGHRAAFSARAREDLLACGGKLYVGPGGGECGVKAGVGAAAEGVP